MKFRSLKLRTFLALIAIVGILLAIWVRSMKCDNPEILAWKSWVSDLSAKVLSFRQGEAQARTQGRLIIAADNAKKAEIFAGRLARAEASLLDTEAACQRCQWCRIRWSLGW